MLGIAYAALLVGAVSIILGLVSRISFIPLPLPGGLFASSAISFANTCFLLAITLILLEILKSKK